MAAVYGKTLRMYKGDGASPESFTAIGGARSDSLTINNATIDITNKDTNDMRRILANAGVQSMDMSISGIFTDSASENAILAASASRAIGNYKLDFPNVGYWKGPFIISNFQITGTHNDAVSYTASLQSAGDYTYTAYP